ncbi:MAG: nucleotidyltransferase [Oscillospiraceae bacterium]|nr:nucleotidyltransferase [Oscillospiraceae bacterium]
MSEISTYFSDFISNIRLSSDLENHLKTAHKELRERLKEDEITKDILIESFLQGSYKRATIIKPEDGHRVDVDVIAVTNIDHSVVTPIEAFSIVMPFVEKYYENHRQQSRSIGITLDKVDMDLVITAAPSEETKSEIRKANLSEAYSIDDIYEMNKSGQRFDGAVAQESFFQMDEKSSWREEPLLIPDYDDNVWYRTHPLEQIRWTREKNQLCNGHFTHVVKALKWWKRVSMPDIKNPKSYPLEHFIGDCCPNGITSIAEGITKTFDYIVANHPTKPYLADRGVPEHDVFEKLTEHDYQLFYSNVEKFAPIAKAALESESISESVELWRAFFMNCEEFPKYSGPYGSYTQRTQPASSIPTGRFG